MDLFEVIEGRRSIRRYKDTPVPDEVLNKILEAAFWAPSWAFTQCVRFIVIKDPAIKEQLVETISRKNPATEAIRKAPVVIAACAVLHTAGFYKGVAVTDYGDWYMFDTALAMQNMALAAHALGLGTVNVGNIPDNKKAREILGLPEGVALVELMPLGYRDEEGFKLPRKSAAETVFYDKYGQH
jgi:nitroreductase